MLPTEVRFKFVSLSSRLYRWMLLAYPADLRSEFGREIVELFDLQLCDSWRSGRARSVIGVWLRALQEFMTIAMVFRVRSLAVPCISTVITASVFSALMMVTARIDRSWSRPQKPRPISIYFELGPRLVRRSDQHATRASTVVSMELTRRQYIIDAR